MPLGGWTMSEVVEEEVVEKQQYRNYNQEIVDIVRGNLAPRLVKEKLNDYHDNDISEALELLKKEERIKLYSVLDINMISDILEYTDEKEFDLYMSELNIRKRIKVLERMEVTAAADYLRRLDKKEKAILIELLQEGSKKEIALSISFDEDEIGSKMSTDYIVIQNSLTIKQAMRALVAQAAENDNISTIYVMDEDGVFYGAIDLKDLITAREGSDLESIIMTSYPYVYGSEMVDDCIERIQDYSEDSIPVVDNLNHLIGVIMAQDIVELVHDVLGDDYAKLGGLSAEEDLEEPLLKSLSKRLPWLVILFGLGMLVSSVVSMFEPVVADLPILVMFQSLVLGMAGNVGTQSLAITIRVLMDEKVSNKEKRGLIWKEAQVGLSNGLILGSCSFLFIGLFLWLIKRNSMMVAFSISFCTGAALLAAMLLASIAGTTIPILFKKLNVDPAVASGPLITTVNDLAAVVVYYGLSWTLLINILKI